MSIHFTGRAARRGLAVLTTAAVVCGLAAGVPSATAATKKKNDRAIATAIAPKASTLTAGRYVVVLRDDAATRYDGGVAGLKATAATNGKSFDARSDKVAAYQAYLTKRQNGIASGVGAEVMSRSTLSASSFTARLSSKQATDLSQSRDVMMVVKDTAFSLDTYKSPEFLGLVGPNNTPGVWAANGGVDKAGAGVVVGILDSGIWPESGSFAGTKIDRNPTGPFSLYRKGNTIYMKKKDGTVFRGVCQPGEKWNVDDCNSKIVGARYYPDAFLDSTKPKERFGAEFISTRDGDGHGSHTASTAAGNNGVDAAVEGRYFGKVSGIAPAAKIAAYKVCFSDLDPNTGGCYTSSTLSAVDDAIADGVDVINYSISGATNTVVDAVEFAFLNAAAAGVFVATSAGNSGPTASTVAHNSPWVTTVAASTHVNYENTVVLDNASEDKYKGASIADQVVGSTSLVDSTSIPAAATEAGVADATLCGPGSLTAAAAGKIVICTRGAYDRVAKSAEVKRAGGSAMILANSQAGQSLDADFHSVPTIHVDKAAGDAIKAYAATAGATASFALGNTTGVETPVPQVAGFSSRGPAVANSADVIKPDISAPGVSVLAAVAPPSGGGRSFDLYSGTSMSSPHVAGLAAFMMGVHPEWSPMAVKSAMMTTAYDLKKADGSPDTNPFNEGAGHVDPKKFLDPGLVVTSTPAEWIGFIKGQGASIPGTESIPATPATDLNIPSMAKGQVTSSVVIKRTFTALRAGTWDVAVVSPGLRGGARPVGAHLHGRGPEADGDLHLHPHRGHTGSVLDRFRDADRSDRRPAAGRAAAGRGLGSGRGQGHGCPRQCRCRHHGRLHRLLGGRAQRSREGDQQLGRPGGRRGLRRHVRDRGGHEVRPLRPRRDRRQGGPRPLRLPPQRRGRAGCAGRPVRDRVGRRAGDPGQPGGRQVPRRGGRILRRAGRELDRLPLRPLPGHAGHHAGRPRGRSQPGAGDAGPAHHLPGGVVRARDGSLPRCVGVRRRARADVRHGGRAVT